MKIYFYASNVAASLSVALLALAIVAIPTSELLAKELAQRHPYKKCMKDCGEKPEKSDKAALKAWKECKAECMKLLDPCEKYNTPGDCDNATIVCRQVGSCVYVGGCHCTR